MSDRNGAKLYLQLTAYELGQLIVILPPAAYKQMDDRLRKKLQQARDQVERDALVEEGIREIAGESAAFSTRFGGDPLSRYDLPDEQNVFDEIDDVLPDSAPRRGPGRPRRISAD
jgi:hypothetical protein